MELSQFSVTKLLTARRTAKAADIPEDKRSMIRLTGTDSDAGRSSDRNEPLKKCLTVSRMISEFDASGEKGAGMTRLLSGRTA